MSLCSLQRYLNVHNAISQEGPLFCHYGDTMTRSSFIIFHVGLQAAKVDVDGVFGPFFKKVLCN